MSVITESEHLVIYRPRYAVISSDTASRNVIRRHCLLDVSITAAKSDAPSSFSTRQIAAPQSVEKELERLFAECQDEIFEDGMDSDFSRRLARLILTRRDAALLELNVLVRSARTPPNLVAEALRTLGGISDKNTHAFRRWILADLLAARSVTVRDGAIVGLANLDDPSVKKMVESRLPHEPSEQLRQDLKQLLDQLETPEAGYALSVEEDS